MNGVQKGTRRFRSNLLRGSAERASDSARAQLALIGGDMASFEWDMQAGLVHCGPRLVCLFGLEAGRETHDIDEFFAVIHPDDVPAIDAAVQRAIAEGVDYHMDWRVRHADGSERWLRGRGRIVERDPDGTPRRMLGVNWDITEGKSQEQALIAMAKEMEHRVKNAFAMVSALTAMAARRCDTPEEMTTMLRGQIMALGEAHSLGLPGANGADGSTVRADELIRTMLRPWTAEQAQMHLEPGVAISAQGAASLAMLLYELATNATKYGGLSAEDATLTVTLARDPNGAARIEWRETTPRSAPRLHPRSGLGGYGTVLLAQAAQVLNAQMVRTFHADGLELSLTIPARMIQQTTAITVQATG